MNPLNWTHFKEGPGLLKYEAITYPFLKNVESPNILKHGLYSIVAIFGRDLAENLPSTERPLISPQGLFI